MVYRSVVVRRLPSVLNRVRMLRSRADYMGCCAISHVEGALVTQKDRGFARKLFVDFDVERTETVFKYSYGCGLWRGRYFFGGLVSWTSLVHLIGAVSFGGEY